jgi:Tfp pilus assembly protein PilO
MRVTATKDFAKSITKGKQYEVITEKQLTFVVVDDEGFNLGLSKEYFEVNKQQTAVEEIQQKIEFEINNIQMDMCNGVEYSMNVIKNRFKNLLKYLESIKEMEKQQIIETYNKGREAGVGDYIDIEWGRNATELTAEQYYNKTFKP